MRHTELDVLAKVSRLTECGGVEACWIWCGGVDGKGYGQVRAKRASDGQHTTRRLHRVVYELLMGAIPSGLDLDHLCRVRHCINPWHLEPVPRRINLLRGIGFPAVNASRTHCPKGHPYSGDNLSIRRNARHCRKCACLRTQARTRGLTEAQRTERNRYKREYYHKTKKKES